MNKRNHKPKQVAPKFTSFSLRVACFRDQTAGVEQLCGADRQGRPVQVSRMMALLNPFPRFGLGGALKYPDLWILAMFSFPPPPFCRCACPGPAILVWAFFCYSGALQQRQSFAKTLAEHRRRSAVAIAERGS